jgi:two-component system cell cycle sensor histidine kinase/response regulator CckA
VHQVELEMQNDELRRTQGELELARDRYQDLYDFAPVGYVTVSETGLILEANLTAATLLGVGRGHLVGRPLTRSIAREDQDVYYHHRKRLFETQEPQACEMRMVRGDGSQFWARIEATAARDSDGQAVCRATMSDITDRKRAERALWEANERLEEMLLELKETQERMMHQERLAAVGQLAAGIAHDFRNLLTTIILYTNMALGRPALPPELTQDLETVIDEAQKAADLVQQILDFSSRAMIERRPLNLASLTDGVLDVLRRTIPENVRLSLEGTGTYVVKADPKRIEQVLMNLATNARDAMPGSGELRFELSRVKGAVEDTLSLGGAGTAEREWVCLAISDTGTGMTEEVQAHLFEPFFTTKGVDKGTGLGLAQVYGIVRQHEGHIGVETELGRGTTFRVYLPAYEGEVEETEAKEPSDPPQGQGETILLVEDNEALREVGRSSLESLDYRVLTAENGHEALAIYEAEGGADLVVTDVVMPEMGGAELMRALTRSDPNLKAVGITGYAVKDIAEELRAAGFLDVIHKPFGVEDLARVIRRVLDMR